MKSKNHPNYISQVNNDLSSPWPLIYIIGIFLGLYMYIHKGYSGVIPLVFCGLLFISLALRTRTNKKTTCPDCEDNLPVDIPFKKGEPFTAKCSRCNINWNLGMVRRAWVTYGDPHDHHRDLHD